MPEKKNNRMVNDIAIKIEQMLVGAWEKFFDYYNKKVPEYPKSWGLNEKEAKESHWICWNEYDLMFHIGRFFYNNLNKKDGREFANIEIHFEKNINDTNFKGYKFENNLGRLKKSLGMWPKVDMIVAYEDKNDPFLLCVEAKYFHSASNWHDQKTPIRKIADDIKKLKAIRDCGIAKKVVFILFDDYYWSTNKNTAKDIETELERIEKKEGIKVLYYSSKSSKVKLDIDKYE